MPLTLITTSQTSGYSLSAGTDYAVLEGVYIAPGNGPGLSIPSPAVSDITNIGISVQGSVYGLDAINLWSQGMDLHDSVVNVGSNGYIFSTNAGIAMQNGEGNSIVNNGEIVATGNGLFLQGGEVSVVNNGIISGGTRGVYFSSSDGGDNVRHVVNTGTITSTLDSPITHVAAVSNINGAEFHLTNSGTIATTGILAVYAGAVENFIDNSGLIAGDINGNDATTLTNSGTINGDVNLSGDADSYQGFNGGVITGLIDLGAGNDTAQLSNSGEVVYAGYGGDTVTGGEGADEVYGEFNNDSIRGREGDDLIDGGSGNDTLRAGAGDDQVAGGTGDDLIRGGSGEDAIDGGGGSDTMFGGSGADVFIFDDATDSPDSSGRDVIQDFVVGVDLIDLSGLGALDFIGTDAFSGAAGEMRVTDPNAIGRVKILVDVDGDGTADMKIILNNTTTLSEDDFIL